MFKNIGSTWIVNLLQIAVVLVLAPYVLHRLGPDQNGVWVTIVSYTGILSLLILGVPMASVRFLAGEVARQDTAGTNRVLATCVVICSVLGGLALATGAVLWLAFRAYLAGPQAASLPPDVVDGASLAFALVSLQVAFAFVMRLPYGVFDAHHDFVARNAIQAGELVLRLATTLVFLHVDASLPALALVQVASMVFEFVATLIVLRRRHPTVRFGWRGADPTLLRPILGFSVFAMLLNVGTLLAFRVDAIVISRFLEPKHATWFDVGNKFFDPMTSLLVAVGAVVMPKATQLSTLGRADELRGVFLKWSKISLSIVLLLGVYLIVAGPDFLGWWVGPEFVEPSGRVLQLLMASFLVYLPVRGVALPILLGLGKPKAATIGLLVMGVANLILSLALVREHGILGVALGTAIPNVFFAGFVLVQACRELSVGVGEYLRYVVGRALVGVVVPSSVLVAYKSALGLDSFVHLVVAGLLTVASFAATWWFFVFRGDPHVRPTNAGGTT